MQRKQWIIQTLKTRTNKMEHSRHDKVNSINHMTGNNFYNKKFHKQPIQNMWMHSLLTKTQQQPSTQLYYAILVKNNDGKMMGLIRVSWLQGTLFRIRAFHIFVHFIYEGNHHILCFGFVFSLASRWQCLFHANFEWAPCSTTRLWAWQMGWQGAWQMGWRENGETWEAGKHN